MTSSVAANVPCVHSNCCSWSKAAVVFGIVAVGAVGAAVFLVVSIL